MFDIVCLEVYVRYSIPICVQNQFCRFINSRSHYSLFSWHWFETYSELIVFVVLRHAILVLTVLQFECSYHGVLIIFWNILLTVIVDTLGTCTGTGINHSKELIKFLLFKSLIKIYLLVWGVMHHHLFLLCCGNFPQTPAGRSIGNSNFYMGCILPTSSSTGVLHRSNRFEYFAMWI